MTLAAGTAPEAGAVPSSAFKSHPVRSEVNPFPGLRPFGPDEAHLFFGREQHIEEILAKLTSRRLSAVVGISGSGKSSVVFAGVVPRLERGYRTRVVQNGDGEARSQWRIAILRPGDDPIANLARSLHAASRVADELDDPATPLNAADAFVEHALLEARLQRSQLGLVEVCDTLNLDPGENLLLVVDQFEELFRYRELSRGRDLVHDSAAAFVQLLLRATEQVRVPIFVMLTMRSDFLGECVQFTGLAEVMNEGQFLLPLLNRSQREQVIKGPLSVAHAPIAQALVQRLLIDAGDMTDQLPVLQHALMRSFELWRLDPQPDVPLNQTHYELAGGMQQALAKHADEALTEVETELGPEGARITERLFRALTERGAHGRGTRRPCRVSEVLATAGTDIVTLGKILVHFTSKQRGFLIVQPAAGPLTADSLIDISHEALMRVWKRLQGFADAEFALAAQLSYLQEAARKHAAGVAGLWSDPELSLALGWMKTEQPSPAACARYGVDLAQVDAFLRASVAAQAANVELQHDAQTLRRFRRVFTEAKTSTLVALLAIPLVLMLQGSGLLDSLWGRMNVRFHWFSVSARYLGVNRTLHPALEVVLLDEQTVQNLRAPTALGPDLSPNVGADWRGLHAQALRHLSDAGASVVAFDFGINSGAPDSPKVAAGTAQLAETIDYARSRGTAVIIGVRKKELDGSIDTEPSVFQALQLTKPGYALGYAANPCTGISNGASVFTTPLVIHPGRPHHASIALASVAALWRTPGIAIDRADRMVFLSGEGGQHDVAYARLARPLTGNPGCGALIAGDQPAQQLIDVSAGDVARGAAQVTPFEDAVSGAGLPDLKGKLVFVGGQLPRDDLHRVLQCGATPWSCAYVDRWGFGLHLDAVNSVLHERAIRPIQPFSQLLLILALCLTVAWQRLQNRGRALWVRRASLLGLVLVDMVLVAGAAVFLEVLMDQAYHLLAMLSVYALVGRLDRR